MTETIKRQADDITSLKARLAGLEGKGTTVAPEKKSDNQLKLEQMLSPRPAVVAHSRSDRGERTRELTS